MGAAAGVQHERSSQGTRQHQSERGERVGRAVAVNAPVKLVPVTPLAVCCSSALGRTVHYISELLHLVCCKFLGRQRVHFDGDLVEGVLASQPRV